jgi:hypothetical protein
LGHINSLPEGLGLTGMVQWVWIRLIISFINIITNNPLAITLIRNNGSWEKKNGDGTVKPRSLNHSTVWPARNFM